MTGPRPTAPSRPSTGLSLLFGVALLGLIVAGGLLAASVGGAAVLAGYVVVVLLLLGLGVARVRRLVAAAAPPPRPVCGCCGSDGPGAHTTPIEVV